jgi:hypothetical protein
LYFIMKYIKNNAKTRINRQFTSGMENNFAGKRSMKCKENKGV